MALVDLRGREPSTPSSSAAMPRLRSSSLAAVVNAQRLVAAAATPGAEILVAAGFERAGGELIRPLDARPAPAEAVRATTLGDLEHAIRSAWAADTSADPEWSEENAARGQCDVTALVVRDFLGGEILLANVVREGVRLERHAWNRLPSGLVVDLTRAQHRGGERLTHPAAGEPLALAEARERDEILSARVRALLDH